MIPTYLLCCYEGLASVHPLYIYNFFRVSQICIVSMNVRSALGFSLIGAGLLSEAGLGLGDVDFDAVSAFCGRVLSY